MIEIGKFILTDSEMNETPNVGAPNLENDPMSFGNIPPPENFNPLQPPPSVGMFG